MSRRETVQATCATLQAALEALSPSGSPQGEQPPSRRELAAVTRAVKGEVSKLALGGPSPSPAVLASLLSKLQQHLLCICAKAQVLCPTLSLRIQTEQYEYSLRLIRWFQCCSESAKGSTLHPQSAQGKYGGDQRHCNALLQTKLKCSMSKGAEALKDQLPGSCSSALLQALLVPGGGPTLARAVTTAVQALLQSCITFVSSLEGQASPQHQKQLAGIVFERCATTDAMPLTSVAALGRHLTQVQMRSHAVPHAVLAC